MQTEYTHAEIQELLGAYCLDAVDTDEAKLVADHLALCATCSAEVASHQEVVGMLGNFGGPAPRGPWVGIAAQLSIPDHIPTDLESAWSTPAATAASAREEQSRLGLLGRRVLVGVGVLALVAVAALGIQTHRLHNQVNALGSVAGAEQQAVSRGGVHQVALRSPTNSSHAEVVLTNSGNGFVDGRHLSTLHSGRTYQIWGIGANGPISLGLLGQRPGVVAFGAGKDPSFTTYAITVEPSGGSVSPSSQPVVSGAVA